MKGKYCTIMWNWRDHGTSKMNHHQPHWSPIFIQKGDVVYIVELEVSPLLWAPSGKPNEWFQQVLLPLDQMKAAHDKKHSKLVRRKHMFHQDNARLHVSLMTRQNCYLVRNIWFICCIHQKLHLWISIYLYLYRSLLMEEFHFPGRL